MSRNACGLVRTVPLEVDADPVVGQDSIQRGRVLFSVGPAPVVLHLNQSLFDGILVALGLTGHCSRQQQT